MASCGSPVAVCRGAAGPASERRRGIFSTRTVAFCSSRRPGTPQLARMENALGPAPEPDVLPALAKNSRPRGVITAMSKFLETDDIERRADRSR